MAGLAALAALTLAFRCQIERDLIGATLCT